MGVDGEGQGIATARGHRVGIMQSTGSLTFPPSLYSDFAWSVRVGHSPAFHSWLPTRSADEITYLIWCVSTRLTSARTPGTSILILSGSHNAAHQNFLHTYIALQKTSLAGIRYIPTLLSGPQVLALFHQMQRRTGPRPNQDARFPLGGENTYMVRVYLDPRSRLSGKRKSFCVVLQLRSPGGC